VVTPFLGGEASANPPPSGSDPAQFVNPFSGTDAGAADYGTGGGAANTFPGAVVPFGMTQWSPDTIPGTTNFAGGYTYSDTSIRGFSLTHISGAGCAIYQDVPFMPTASPVTSSPAQFGSSNVTTTAAYSHLDEQAEPGYYRVRLNPSTATSINSELTATTRSGLGRFTYPPTANANMIINSGGSAMADSNATVDIDPAHREVSGSASSGHFCYQPDSYTVYYVAIFSRPFTSYGTWKRQVLSPGSTSDSDTTIFPYNCQPGVCGQKGLPGNPSGTSQTGAYVGFDTTQDQVVEVRVGVSFVSVANARKNLQAENPGWDFNGARANARAAWNGMLSRIDISGGTLDKTRTFYTALYHALIPPRVFSDVNGQYPGMDGQVHTAQGYTQYADYSGWDTYRSQVQLVAMLAPQQGSDMMQSLVTDARESGWLPKWPLANGQADEMVGDPADPIIGGTHALGATRFDASGALRAMVKGATDSSQVTNTGYVERQALAEYQALGFVPQEEEMGVTANFFSPAFVWAPAATTLEYTTADFSIARFAAAVGDVNTCTTFMQRSTNWRKLFNPATGYIEPRYASVGFSQVFDPTSSYGFAEGDAAQYSWMVPYDLEGLFAAMGGKAAASARLDAFFQQLNAGPNSLHAFLGNEPTLETPWEYDWLGQPYKTQATVRRALLTLYNASPGGYPGNDDLGEMSSWYVFGAIGFYPEIPGTDVLALGSPLFPNVTMHLPGGDVSISAPAASDAKPYVAGLTLNGGAYGKPWLSFQQISHGAVLTYDLRANPDVTWGSNASDAPPSYGPGSAAAACTGGPPPSASTTGQAPAGSGAGAGGGSLPNTATVPSSGLGMLVGVLAGLIALCARGRRGRHGPRSLQ
jgi:predicted alpha-1,2-mannosidase